MAYVTFSDWSYRVFFIDAPVQRKSPMASRFISQFEYHKLTR